MSTNAAISSRHSLRCCEYVNTNGQRRHLMGACCDCETLTLCGMCITCRRVPSESWERFWSTLEDRCRLPSCSGHGARKIPPDVLIPILVVPVSLVVGSINAYLTMAVIALLPFSMGFLYGTWQKRAVRRRCKLLFIWGLTSVITIFVVFQVFVITFREILLWEELLLSSMFGAMMIALYHSKKDPGILVADSNGIRKRVVNGGSEPATIYQFQGENNAVIPADKVTWVDSRPIENGVLQTWCNVCGLNRVIRAGHCPLCQYCVNCRDHHCHWIDQCVGMKNHRAFFMALLFLVLTGSYGVHLTLSTVCTPEMYLNYVLLPADCRFVYSDFQNAISFTSACYSTLLLLPMTLNLMYQCILISQNVTSQELHVARGRGLVKFCMFAVNNPHNQGPLHNWLNFLTGRRKHSLPIISQI